MTRQTSVPLENISLNTADRQVRELVRSFMNDFGLDLRPPYQRDEVWTEDQKIALVRSWMIGLPTGVVIFNDRSAPPWYAVHGDVYAKEGEAIYACIDGQQRITAGREWFEGELAVPATWFPEDHVTETEKTADGPYVRYPKLTLPAQRHFANRAHLAVATATVATIEEEAEIFLLVNGGGTPQTSEDMANAARIAKGKN